MTQTVITSPPPSSLDPTLIVPVVNSIRAVFGTMVKLDLVIQRPHVKTSPGPGYDVSGKGEFAIVYRGSVSVGGLGHECLSNVLTVQK